MVLTEIEALNKMRVDASGSQNALVYYEMCERLGVEPEDSQLYEQGYLEARKIEESVAALQELVEQVEIGNRRYFLREAEKIGRNVQDVQSLDWRAYLLVQHDPTKFGTNASALRKSLGDKSLIEVFERTKRESRE